MKIEELYVLAGSNYNEVKTRLPENLMATLLKMFLNDKSVEQLNGGIKQNDPELAFRAAHTLKGVCLNLGLNNLSTYASELTEKLRPRVLVDYDVEYQKLIGEYNKITEAIKSLD